MSWTPSPATAQSPKGVSHNSGDIYVELYTLGFYYTHFSAKGFALCDAKGVSHYDLQVQSPPDQKAAGECTHFCASASGAVARLGLRSGAHRRLRHDA